VFWNDGILDKWIIGFIHNSSIPRPNVPFGTGGQHSNIPFYQDQNILVPEY